MDMYIAYKMREEQLDEKCDPWVISVYLIYTVRQKNGSVSMRAVLQFLCMLFVSRMTFEYYIFWCMLLYFWWHWNGSQLLLCFFCSKYCLCVCLCLRVCTCVREREGEGGRQKIRWRYFLLLFFFPNIGLLLHCVFVNHHPPFACSYETTAHKKRGRIWGGGGGGFSIFFYTRYMRLSLVTPPPSPC